LEPVLFGESRLNDKGSGEIEIDTAALAPFLQGSDHRLIVEAEVQDESRRTVRGKGQVLVVRRNLSATLTLDRNWYTPNSRAVVEVSLQTANGAGIAARGSLSLVRIRYSGTAKQQLHQEVEKTWEVRTDAQGRLSHRLDLGSEGQ